MAARSTFSQSTTLGPFLTLLVRTALRRGRVDRERPANEPTAPVVIPGHRTELTEESSNTRTQVTLGPFLTLILTLHRRALNNGGAWRRSCACWPSGPFVRTYPPL